MKKSWILIGALAFVVACGTTKMIAPTQADVDRSRDNFPGLTLDQLTLGQEVYMASCNKCHPYKKPSSRSPEEWKHIIPEMTAKANHKMANSIDANKEAALLRYVSVMCKAQR